MNYRSHSRWAPLRGAMWFALGFIALRVAYRVVFLGASGSGTVLWAGRPIHLDGPFRMISLFGPVTVGGLWSAMVDALPFALGILACGLLFSLLDVRRFLGLAARARIGRGVLTALAIGISTYPSLVVTWRSMRQMHRLRRERGGLSVLGPLFERTLERANTLGASMEVRGFGRARTTPELDCATPLTARDVGLRRGDRVLLAPTDFYFDLGNLVLLTGATGSGKTTLLRSIVGLDPTVLSGSLAIGGVDRLTTSIAATSEFVGYVPQNVRDAFVAATVREELAFGLVSAGFANGAIDARLSEVIPVLGLEGLLDRHVEELSAGEAVIVALGAALATRPTLLLLDEPFADLDAGQAQRVAELLQGLATTTQMCIVVAEHRINLVAPFASRRLHLEEGALVEASLNRISGMESSPAAVDSNGEAIRAIVSPNGSGKTTALIARAQAAPGTVALVPEVLGDFFVRDSVDAECRRSDHTAGVAAGTTKGLLRSLIGASVDDLSGRHPRDLSHGQQLALAISVQMAGGASELLIDEPTRGLDSHIRLDLASLLGRVSQTTRVTVATHDPDFVHLLRARVEAVPV
jgi:energy-coupling factor transporter ATP-binding protein EcfA2